MAGDKNVLGWVNVAAIVVIAVLGYVLVNRHVDVLNKNTAALADYNKEIAKIDLSTRWQQNIATLAEDLEKARESKANTTLAELNANLARLEGEVKYTRDKLDIMQRQTQVVAVFGEFMNYIHPNVVVKSAQSFEFVNEGYPKIDPQKSIRCFGRVRLVYEITNLGKYIAIVDSPEIILSRLEFKEGQPIEMEGRLRIGEDYKLTSLPIPGEVYPHNTNRYEVFVIPPEPPYLTRLSRPAFALGKSEFPYVCYIATIFKVRTADQIVDSLSPLLEGLTTKEALVASSKSSYTDFAVLRAPRDLP